ncbi:AAA family ATPase [Plectonema cf. radiosum LEGE 06105]|uniref:AAA family ATPase n=1 Tax=Plectonema cf. radiosum LEGE 06105 TaxID=945769 RepID=A0A8J7JSK2_9CYAN|nr:ATP-binding protein [Plectonema radiosum]MBE9212654.1 AAA family ATPase [Plectonema cf. radiosum LEGE 06105]
MLKEIHLKQVGPADHFDVEFADRLNIFTGDNGLGKSFLLDVAWWVLSGNWVEQPAYPQRNKEGNPKINSLVSTEKNIKEYQSEFDFSEQQWRNLQMPPLLKEVIIYVRVDGGFSVFDPARNRDNAYNFNPDTLWNGLKSNGKVLCNGLIQDWVTWQNQPNKYPFKLFSNVIKKLAPHHKEWIEIGEPTRVSVEDVRDIPTVNLPYGNVPVTLASAGMKRILGLAYLLVWTWYEHKKASELRQESPTNQIVLLIDEVESHLHPQWQRVILPAILDVARELQNSINIQALVTTHSPLVLASLEPDFDEEEDRLFLFKLEDREVTLDEIPWSKQGDTVGWLTSEIFGLKQARSFEAENAIEAAEAWMRHDDLNAFPENLRTHSQIHQELQRLLPGHDPFWARWIVTSEKRNSAGLSGV